MIKIKFFQKHKIIIVIVLTCFLLFSKSIASPNEIYANPYAFKMTVDTRYYGETPPGQFKIQVNQTYNFNYNVDCNGDGIFEFYFQNGNTTCTYPYPGIYQVWITGYLILRYNTGADSTKIISIDQWGNIPWSDFENSFLGAINLRIINATDTPNLFNVIGGENYDAQRNRYYGGGLSGMFGFAPLTYVHPSINLWNTSNVRNMQGTFYNAIDFNQDIGNWNTSNVVNMFGMFINARSFNRYIGNWNTSNVWDMGMMFSGASSFNQNIGNWNTSNVGYMDMMFKGARSFNQDISRWNTGRVISMEEMFMDATSFNQNIRNWNTSMVTNMKGMFRNARAFNQNIGNWNVSNVTNMENMLDYSGLSIQNYDLTLIGWASRPVRPNVTLGAMGLKFCNGSNARSILTSPPNNWNIIGDTYECPCVNTPPGQAILNYPINNTIVSPERVNLVYDTNISGWGNNCNGNVNTYSVHLSQNCSGSYINLGSVNSIDNLQPNQTYCWFVSKSNGALTSQSQIQVFRTCVNTPPGQAILNYPINNTIVYSKRVNLVYDTNISGWGNNCNGNVNTYSVHLSQNCSGSYINLGSVNSIDNLQPNQTYCWFVSKSNGAMSSQSQIQVFRTSDNLVNNVSVISTNRCVNGYIGMLINPIVNNPVRWRISGVIPQNSNLQYITFVMLPTHSESNDRINKNIGITKATTQDNANSVAIDITQNFIRLYSSNNNFITSNNFYSTASPFNNYNVENVNVTLMGNSYTIDFSIKFIENFKSNLYSIYSMAVFRDQANNEYSTNSFSQSSNLVLRRYDTNIGSGIWRVDMVPPTVVSGITRSGAKGQIIKFDPLTYIKSSDLQSGINNNFRYFSVRSLGTNNGEWKLISQNNNITINTNQHINYSSIGQHINPIGLQQIDSGAEYEIINTNVNYQARIGLLDNACNFGYRDIMINSLDSSWIATLDGNVYVEKEFRNVNIPDGAVKLGE